MKKLIFLSIALLALTNLSKAQNLNTPKLDSLFSAIETYGKGMGSVSIFQNGKEIYQNSYGYSDVENGVRNSADTKFRIGSITKTFTATIIMKLIEQGKLSLTSRLSEYYPMIPNADIGVLYGNYAGSPITITDDIVVEGYVTANDLSGNYFKTFVIQDGTGAVEINAGIADIHNYYQAGRRVVVKAEGLALGSYNGVVQLGSKVNPYSDYRVEGFGTRAILGRYVFTGIEFSPAEPLEMEIKELDRAHCGKLVRLGKLLAWPASDNTEGRGGATWAFAGSGGEAPATGYRQFRDYAGDSLTVVTSGYANFAARPLPADSVTITGILIYGKFDGTAERFGIKLRDLDDVN